MNKDPEAKIESLFTWLLNPPPDDSPDYSGEPPANPNPNLSEEILSEEIIDEEFLDPLDSEDLDRIYSPNPNPQGYHEEIGDIPAVQDRFQALLKRRIQTEIQANLPLFPWESEVMEYRDEPLEVALSALAVVQPWIAQLRQLNLPISVEFPEAVLTQLLEGCQQVAQSTLKEGAKMVQAVEALFPNEFVKLNQVASPLLLGEMRSPQVMQSVPIRYDRVDRERQMELSLLLAQTIIDRLTLTPVLNGAVSHQEWETEEGTLHLLAEYREVNDESQLRIQVLLPSAGRIEFQSAGERLQAERRDRGHLNLELSDVTDESPCSLMVQLESSPETPLMFAIAPKIS